MKTEHELLAHITVNPAIMIGKPTIRGTRLTAEIILEKLAYGVSEQEVLASYPFLETDDIRACLLYAARMLSLEEVIAI
jgi:uncharacterized protein (DUF433 family)